MPPEAAAFMNVIYIASISVVGVLALVGLFFHPQDGIFPERKGDAASAEDAQP